MLLDGRCSQYWSLLIYYLYLFAEIFFTCFGPHFKAFKCFPFMCVHASNCTALPPSVFFLAVIFSSYQQRLPRFLFSLVAMNVIFVRVNKYFPSGFPSWYSEAWHPRFVCQDILKQYSINSPFPTHLIHYLVLK